MQTAEASKPLKPTRNRRGEVEPQAGEIWRDRDGHHNFILETFENDGAYYAHTLVLETGAHWSNEPFDSWDNPHKDGLPYYRVLVG